ncbi:odorant receptor 13a-like [Trichoplusia ni]|uniref:Odorant receptor n=3 Tax=Noctuidae TaxID=7100 RepID=A0A7E5WA71_TRINI|nr:odorant receptor 13a-like [Trichoplusia ni]
MFLYADDAVIGINGPMDYKYMKWLRFVLRIISGWPGKALGEKTIKIEGMGHAYYNTILSLIYLALGIAFIKKNAYRFTFLQLGHLYIVLLMNMLSTSRALTLCLSQKYRSVAKIFIQKVHLFYYKEKSDYAMEVHVQVHKLSHIFSIYLTGMLWLTVMLFNLIPMYNNYSAGNFKTLGPLVNTTYEHAVYCLYPFDFETTFNGYIGGLLSGWYGSILCGSSVCMFDLFLCLMIFNLYGHFKILIHNLDNFPRPATAVSNEAGQNDNAIIAGAEMYSDSELEIVTVKLKECIQYHMVIVDFTDRMSDAFGMALFVYYMFHQVSGCLLLLECSDVSAAALTRYLPLTIILFGELILLSIIFETIGSMSEKLKDAVYNMPWEYMDTKNRRTVLIFLIRVQEPIHVKAGGLVNVGVTTMASILKTSFSYFAFLRTF